MDTLHDTFKTAEQAGQWIIEHSPDSPTTVFDVSDELQSVKKDVDEVDRELADLKQQYQLRVLDSKPFNVVLDDFANWLADIDRKLTKAKKLSAAYPVVSKQNDKLQVICLKTGLQNGRSENLIDRQQMVVNCRNLDNDRSMKIKSFISSYLPSNT